MAESPERSGLPGSQWIGHRLAPLPPGQSYLRGGERPAAQPRSPDPSAAPPSPLPADVWPFDAWDEPGNVLTRPAAQPAAAPTATNHRGVMIVLTLLGLAAILTIVIARRTDPVKEPQALPEAPSHVVTTLTRDHPTVVRTRVGEYIRFALPDGRTYSTVIEQTSATVPPVSSLDLPGQQPQLRADTIGRALVEVFGEPPCADPGTCPDQRALLGAVQIIVTS